MDMSSWAPVRLSGLVLCWGHFLGIGLVHCRWHDFILDLR